MFRQAEHKNGAHEWPPEASQPVEPIGFIEFAGPQPALNERDRGGTGLPGQATRLLDRDREIAQLRQLLHDPNRRLITITGPGGVGKTRLALEIARQSAADFPDGVVFISLAPARHRSHVILAIARGIGVRLTGQANTLDTLSVSLHEQRILLLLDNFEQVIDAAVDISQLLAACPRLNVLVTSRTPLRIADEYVFPTAPLSLGSNHPLRSKGDRLLPGAVQLFVERAGHADPDFRLTEQNAGAVLEICRRLDGLPLAIELAAARIGSVSPFDLLERLDPRLPMLADGNRDLPERQQTMRSAIAWSYQLLGETDQQLFRWLSIFVGGFRLAAAERLERAMRPAEFSSGESGAIVVDGISALLAANLLHRVPGHHREYRYAMLEVVREFGLEQLAAHGELLAAQTAHADWCASIREWLDPNRFQSGERLIDHLWDIDAEHPNLRVALAFCEERGDFHQMLEIAGALAVFWHHRGFLKEGRKWLEQALDLAPGAPAESRCWALAGLGLVRWTQGDFRAAVPVLTESLELATNLDHLELQALSLHVLALTDMEQGDLSRARDRIEPALTLWRALELPSDEAMALHILSCLPPRPGQPDTRMDEALRCLAIFESIGHTSGISYAHHRIGRLTQSAGDEHRAFSQYALAIATWLSIDERWAVNLPFVMVAEIAAGRRQYEIAAMLIGVIDARMRLSDSELPIELKERFDRVCRAIEVTQGSAVLQSQRHVGSTMTADQINAMVSALGSRIFERSILSPREVEVLRRLAAGETDREIADALFLSPRTVHSHVSHILTKLDVRSRREAVRRGHELGVLDLAANTR